MSDVIIREAVLADAKVIVELVRELAATMSEASPIKEGTVEQYLAHATGSILLAEEQGMVIGLLSYSFRPDLYHGADTCLIEELIINKDRRGRGAGGLLIDTLVERLSVTDCAEVSVSTMSAEAIRFYKRHGFTDEAVLLEKHLR